MRQGPTLPYQHETATGDAALAETAASNQPVAAGAPEDGPRLPACSRAEFELGAEIGRGGLGRVVLAHDPVFGRQIAIKELLSTHPDARARFLREAMITARLQHPAIVPVYLAGTWPDGSPFYGMKRIEGESLAARLRRCTTLADRLALLPSVIATCEAVAYAHQRRIIHRDLKPSNVMVGELGETVVIDWGLAKDLDDRAVQDTGEIADSAETLAGAVIGTPAYMPPEQAAGEAVDARADVYAIGAMLYEVVGGAMPYAGAPDARAVVSAVLAGPPIALSALAPSAPRDLIAIVERAMDRAPTGRYADATAFAADLRRFQTGQLVSVRDYGTVERFARWTRRHRAAVSIGCVAVAALAGAGVYTVFATRAESARANEAARVAELARADADDQRARAASERDAAMVANARLLVGRDPMGALEVLAKLPSDSAQWPAVRPIAAEAASGGIVTRRTELPFRPTLPFTSANGAILAAPELGGERVAVYDIATGGVRVFAGPRGGHLQAASPDGTHLLFVGPDLVQIRVTDGTRTTIAKGPFESGMYSRDGKQVIAGGADALVVAPTSGGPTRVIPEAVPSLAAYEVHDDGRVVVVDAAHRQIRIHEPAGATRTIAIPVAVAMLEGLGYSTFIGLGRELVAIVAADHSVGVVDLADGAWIPAPRDGTFDSVQVDDAARAVEAWREDNHGVRWQIEGGRFTKRTELERSTEKRGAALAGHHPDVVWDLGGNKRLLGLRGTTITEWRIDGADRAVCPAARTLAIRGPTLFQVGARPGTIVACDVATGATHELVGPPISIARATASPNGRYVFSGGDHDEYAIWDVRTGRGVALTDPVSPCWYCELGITDAGVPFVGVRSYAPARTHCAAFAAATDYASDGDLAARLADGGLQVCDVARDANTTLPADRDTVLLGVDAAARLVFGGTPRGAYIWDARTDRRTTVAVGEAITRVWQVTDQAIVMSSNVSAFVIDRETGRELARIRLLEQPRNIAVSPQRDRLVVAGTIDHAQLFDLATGAHRPLPGEGPGRFVAFVDGGRAVITVGERGAWRWKDTMPADPAALRAWVLSPRP